MTTWTELDPRDLGAAPVESIATWMRAVRTMDRDALDSFVRRMWRTWSPASLGTLATAVDMRRSQLDRE